MNKEEKGRNKSERQQDRDKAFVKAMNDPVMFNKIVENYGQILHDGDFEKYQPLCNTPMPKDIEQYLIREQCRLLWINGRFTEHLEEDWCANHAVFTVLQDRLVIP